MGEVMKEIKKKQHVLNSCFKYSWLTKVTKFWLKRKNNGQGGINELNCPLNANNHKDGSFFLFILYGLETWCITGDIIVSIEQGINKKKNQKKKK